MRDKVALEEHVPAEAMNARLAGSQHTPPVTGRPQEMKDARSLV
jgi:hypothetical protein